VDELKTRTPRHVLDVGTGTGILAFAAAKILKRPVVAGDIDPEAVRVARENARLNGIGAFMKLYVGPGIRHAAADRAGRFDLVFANILAKPLRMLAPSLARVASQDGTIILSGLLIRDIPGVLSAYAHQGWYLQRRYDLDGWAALVLKRGNARPLPRL
jgi:ribosomal protein L11 methyltransferase